MHTTIILSAILGLVVLQARAADVPTRSCDQIREQIAAQTGLLPKANTELLQLISARPECQFVAAEVYRAAYGDKPLPQQEPRRQRQHEERDDD